MILVMLMGCAMACFSEAQKVTNLRVPYLGATDSAVYLVWDAVEDAADYALLVNGTRLAETASQNYAHVAPMAAGYRDAFYAYYTKKRVGFAMIRVAPTSFCADGLQAETAYTFSVAALSKKGKIIAQSDPLTVRTQAAPPQVLNITDYGARAADALPTDANERKALAEQNGAAVQKAIDACPPNGVVYVPKGLFLTAPFRLKSDMTLTVDGEILGSPFAEHYEFGFLLYPYRTDERYYGLINVDGAERICITGTGVIDGNGWKYLTPDGKKVTEERQFYQETGDPDVSKGKQSDVDRFRLPKYRHSNAQGVYADGVLSSALCAAALSRNGKTPQTATKDELKAAYGVRSTMLLLRNVKGLFITGITLRNPSNHTLNILDSEQVSVTGIIETTYDCNNGDGIGLIHTKDAVIWNNFIDTGDDSIVFSSGVGEAAFTSGEQAVKNVRIFGNFIHHGHGGVAFGSHTALGMTDVHVWGNVFSHTDVPFRCKSNAVTGGGASNILFERNAIAEANQAFLITTSYNNESTGTALGAVFHDITVRDCTIYGVGMNTICLENDKHFPAYNLCFERLQFAQIGRGPNSMGWEALVNVRDSVFKGIVFASYTKEAIAKKRNVAWKSGVVGGENVFIEQK